jgi:hypothetical protein
LDLLNLSMSDGECILQEDTPFNYIKEKIFNLIYELPSYTRSM